jgi:hypothetical protein
MSVYQNIWTPDEDMRDKIYVIPGTGSEGYEYVKKQCVKRYAAGETSVPMSDYVIINEGGVAMLRGIRNPHGVFIGTWRDRKDLHDICIQLNLSHNFRNAAIHEIMRDYLGY